MEGQRSDSSAVLLLRRQSASQAEWQHGNPRVPGESVCLLSSPVAAGKRSATLEGDSKGCVSCYVQPDSQSGDLKPRNVEIKLQDELKVLCIVAKQQNLMTYSQ